MTNPSIDVRISGDERAALYRIMSLRRDVRSFTPEPIADDVLVRLLRAAHDGPSVGYSQPWRFVVVRSPEVRARLVACFEEANAVARLRFAQERQSAYDRLKLEGLREAPVILLVGCERTGTETLGRDTMPQTDLYSTACAVQNLWLAARAENLGVGWVSILDPKAVEAIAGFPERVELLAVLCVGTPAAPDIMPKLERVGWKARERLASLVALEAWGTPPDAALDAALEREERTFQERFRE